MERKNTFKLFYKEIRINTCLYTYSSVIYALASRYKEEVFTVSSHDLNIIRNI